MGERSGLLRADLRIDDAYPRPRSFRTSAAYAAHCDEVSAALEASMAQRRLA